MRFQYSILPPLFPVSQPFILRFSLRVVNVYQSTADAPADHYDAPSPLHAHLRGATFSPASSPVPSYATSRTMAPQQLQHPSTPPRANQGE